MMFSISAADSMRRPSLMIADDDPVVRAMLANQLGERFQLVGFAADADEAIALAEDRQPDAALIDVQMPAGGGLRATVEIRARAPRTAIVVLSADEQRDSVLRLLRAGAVCYARKGASTALLAAKVSDSIDAHALARCES